MSEVWPARQLDLGEVARQRQHVVAIGLYVSLPCQGIKRRLASLIFRLCRVIGRKLRVAQPKELKSSAELGQRFARATLVLQYKDLRAIEVCQQIRHLSGVATTRKRRQRRVRTERFTPCGSRAGVVLQTRYVPIQRVAQQ